MNNNNQLSCCYWSMIVERGGKRGRQCVGGRWENRDWSIDRVKGPWKSQMMDCVWQRMCTRRRCNLIPPICILPQNANSKPAISIRIESERNRRNRGETIDCRFGTFPSPIGSLTIALPAAIPRVFHWLSAYLASAFRGSCLAAHLAKFHFNCFNWPLTFTYL